MSTRIDHRLPDVFRFLGRKGTQRRTSVPPCSKHNTIFESISDNSQRRQPYDGFFGKRTSTTQWSGQDVESSTHRIYASELYTRYMGSSGKYMPDVRIPTKPANCLQLLRQFRLGIKNVDNRTRNQLRVVSTHGDHVRVVRVCPYTNQSCRCSWLKRSRDDEIDIDE